MNFFIKLGDIILPVILSAGVTAYAFFKVADYVDEKLKELEKTVDRQGRNIHRHWVDNQNEFVTVSDKFQKHEGHIYKLQARVKALETPAKDVQSQAINEFIKT